MADGFDIPFVMHGARQAMAGGVGHIEEQVKALEQAVTDNPGLAFDLSKTVIESACRTILTERRVGYNPDDDLPSLFKAVTTRLPFLPPAAAGVPEVRRSLAQTLSGLSTALQGVCELRNQSGFASHGAAGPRPAMESVQAFLAAGAADAIIGFLYRVHSQDRLRPSTPVADYAGQSAFNDYVDDVHGLIRIFDAEFKPSDVLFQMEPETYRVYLTEFTVESEGGEAQS
jgi:hypothetical protein